MKSIPLRISVSVCLGILAVAVMGSTPCLALDQAGLTGEFSLPDRSHDLIDSQDEYYDAVQRLQDADAAVVRARESAIKQQQSTPEYVAAVKAVDSAYQAFNEKRNALLDDLAKKNTVYSQMKSQMGAIDAQIETARQNAATTPEQLDELYKNRETFNRQVQQQESDAITRAGITPLLQQWQDASKKLADLQAKQKADVEGTDRLKAAIAMADDARGVAAAARAALGGTASADPASTERSHATDYLCRYSGSSFAGNDGWWTYGWNRMGGGSKSTAPPTGK